MTNNASETSTTMMLRGKVAIVTGARRSIGEAIVRALAEQGAKVVVHYRSGRDEAEKLVAELCASGSDAVALGGNLSRSAEVKALFDESEVLYGGVDIIVANAGATAVPSATAEVTDEVFEFVIDSNTRATFYVLREAARKIRDGGRIINISSSSVRFELPGFSAYATSKAGALTTIGILAKELGARGITANSIMAGPIASGFLDPNGEIVSSAPDGLIDDLASAAPSHRLGLPSDIAPLAVFLASAEAGWINGQTILTNNGATV